MEPPAKRSEISSIFFFFYFSSNRSIKKQRSILVRLFLFVQRRSFLALACGSPPGSGGSNYSLLVSSAQLSSAGGPGGIPRTGLDHFLEFFRLGISSDNFFSATCSATIIATSRYAGLALGSCFAVAGDHHHLSTSHALTSLFINI